MKSRGEVDGLKDNWWNDPIYDIDPPPEGFEEFAEELAEFQERWNKIWDKCYQLGVPRDSYKLIEYLDGLERRISELQRAVEELSDAVKRAKPGGAKRP